ncbi:MAG TPA: thioredoxin-dependent thiol peroxidase [Armatimonadota bacterium]|jgi:peroxiredoxin Q/BCP
MQVGDQAPDFTLPAVTREGEETVQLSALQGRKVILYFYPKDDTPGCTKEACGFRDLAADFAAKGAAIYGISPDTSASHAKFINKFSLPFPLLADADKAVCEAYGVWTEKKNYGKTYMGVERTTFLIDETGRIARIWPKVKVEGHVDAVLEALGN